METGDAWRVLGLEPTADLDDARRAYRLRARELHPDRHQGAPPEELAEAERAMRELTEAWTTVQHAEPPPPPPSVEECLAWFTDALVEAGPAADDPVSDDDVEIALEPVAVAVDRPDFEIWFRRRLRTLAIALAVDRVKADEVPAEWQRGYDRLKEAGVDAALVLLLDQLLDPS